MRGLRQPIKDAKLGVADDRRFIDKEARKRSY